MSSESQKPRTIDAFCGFAYLLLVVGWSYGTWIQWGRGEHFLASIYLVFVICGVFISAIHSCRYLRDTRRCKSQLRQTSLSDKTVDPNQH